MQHTCRNKNSNPVLLRAHIRQLICSRPTLQFFRMLVKTEILLQVFAVVGFNDSTALILWRIALHTRFLTVWLAPKIICLRKRILLSLCSDGLETGPHYQTIVMREFLAHFKFVLVVQILSVFFADKRKNALELCLVPCELFINCIFASMCSASI
jgi:hypothetical protein